MKKWFAFTMVICLLLAMTACAAKNKTTPTTGSAPDSTRNNGSTEPSTLPVVSTGEYYNREETQCNTDSSQIGTTDPGGVSIREYYTKADFQSIIIDKSTFRDVYELVPAGGSPIYVTSYGGYCEYPTESGGCIRIKFYGKDMVVSAIEEDTQQTSNKAEFSVLAASKQLTRGR